MSVVFDTNSSDVIFAPANYPPAISTRCGWTKFTAIGAGGSGGLLTNLTDSGPSNAAGLTFASSSVFQLTQTPTGNVSFGSAPSTSGWFFWAITNAGAGAGNLLGYWQNNAGGGFVTASQTGLSFTPNNDYIGQVGSATCSAEFAYYKEFDSVLTPTQLAAQFLSAAPISGPTCRRHLVMAAAASAGTDTSGNGFNFSVSGSLTDGADNPTFPSSSPNGGMLLRGVGAVAPLAWIIRRRNKLAIERRWARTKSGLIIPEYRKVS